MNISRRRFLYLGIAIVALPLTGCTDNEKTEPKADLTVPPPPELPKDRRTPGAGK